MRLHLIGCSILTRELSDAIARSAHTVDAQYLPAGLHDKGSKRMREALQEAVDAADLHGYDAIAIGYGLYGNGIVGLEARSTPLIVPRAHDCITLLMGSRDRYREFINANPGVYFRSVGWTERASELLQQLLGSSVEENKEALMAKYGDDAGAYLHSEFNRYQCRYNKLTYIRMGVVCEDYFIALAESEAAQKRWTFEVIQGSNSLFRKLLSGNRDEDLLLVPPNHRIVATYGDTIVDAARCI